MLVVEWIESNEGTAGYDYHWHGNASFGMPLAPHWVTKMTGMDLFASIHNVNFSESDIGNIEQLSLLPNLERVWLNDSQVSDLSPLSNTNRLIELNVGGTSVADFSPIRNHDQLLWLTVPDSVSNDKLVELQRWLPDCEIRRVSDPH